MPLVEPAPPDPACPRRSSRPFPPYRFVPGLNAHPRRHPQGHAYGTPETPPPYVPPERWRENETYLYGVDLYNFAYWWECHEALEGLWHLTGHKGVEASFLQGVIQAAAANLKRHMGVPEGARRLGKEAVDRLRSVGAPRFMGADLVAFAKEVESLHVAGTSSAIPLLRLD
jgi:hypothetical protein